MIEKETEEQREMTMREAGRRGGTATSARYGHEHYRKIGRRGGLKVLEKYGPGQYARMGKLSAEAVRADRHEFFQRMAAWAQASGWGVYESAPTNVDLPPLPDAWSSAETGGSR